MNHFKNDYYYHEQFFKKKSSIIEIICGNAHNVFLMWLKTIDAMKKDENKTKQQSRMTLNKITQLHSSNLL